jgi:hypothetical protein
MYYRRRKKQGFEECDFLGGTGKITPLIDFTCHFSKKNT